MFPTVLLAVLLAIVSVVPVGSENPYERGCLFEKQVGGGGGKLRVCNSEDDSATTAAGRCRQPDIDHLEIRILAQNWESVFFETWLLQIVLSEILDVPTTVETGTPNASLNFYDPNAPFEYGTAGNDVTALVTAAQETETDCRNVADSVPYQPCAHMVPETWVGMSSDVQEAVFDDSIEVPQSLGMVGEDHWFITKFAALQDPTLDSYIGLQGEENRRKLAETFKRPTTWKEYCTQVSPNNCTTDDGVSVRAPQTLEEEGRMFVERLYTGHFRATEKNDCNTTQNCTGFVADYPCGWRSFVEAQTYHLNIALESEGDEIGSRGYTYEQLLDIWDAANATKSPLIGKWWNLDPEYSKYLGTDSELHRVTFPTPTQTCIDARVSVEERCSLVEEERVGDPAGVCDEPPQAIDKLIVATLREATSGLQIPKAERSPAYDVLNSFTISEFQIFEIFDYWKAEPTPRDALCRWASENVDYLYAFVPDTFPRSVEKSNDKSALFYVTTILGSLAVVLVVVTAFLVHRQRKKPAIRYAQISFMRLLLAGDFLVSIGAIVKGIPPTTVSCMCSLWFVNIGFTLEFAPLIVKVAAINKMMASAQRMQRTKIRMKNLFFSVAVITGIVVIYLILWTVLDPPTKQGEYSLTTTLAEDQSTIIDVSYYCSSESDAWAFIAVGWDVLLLLVATVLAIAMRNIREEFNESRTLAFLIYSQLVFALLRLVTYFLANTDILNSVLHGVRSIMYRYVRPV